ncbi:MAG: ImmA/IrrE family metallo-endopeptidase [Candidatus Marinimicrobia bacterium]|nr:ImmA/IrrE family metallo-endopeptidase [Candidatus Neomarinimicrobiota bacterium]
MYELKDIRAYVDSVIRLSKQALDKPLDINKILRKFNLKLTFFDKNSLDLEDQNIRGILDYEKKKLFIRNEEVKPRMRFTIAHEIGHYILPEHIEHFANCKKLCTDDIWNSRDNVFEIEANQFAGELLFKGSHINTFYENQPIVDFNMIEKVANESDVSFEATSRHLIANSPAQQILFIYYKEHPEKQPSVTCSHTMSNGMAMGIFKPYFAPKMSTIEKEHFYMEEKIFDDLILGSNINFTENDYKRSYILTLKKLRRIIE